MAIDMAIGMSILKTNKISCGPRFRHAYLHAKYAHQKSNICVFLITGHDFCCRSLSNDDLVQSDESLAHQ